MATTTARASMLFSGSHPDGQFGLESGASGAGGTPRTWHAIEGHRLSLEASLENIQACDLRRRTDRAGTGQVSPPKRSSLMAV